VWRSFRSLLCALLEHRLRRSVLDRDLFSISLWNPFSRAFWALNNQNHNLFCFNILNSNHLTYASFIVQRYAPSLNQLWYSTAFKRTFNSYFTVNSQRYLYLVVNKGLNRLLEVYMPRQICFFLSLSKCYSGNFICFTIVKKFITFKHKGVMRLFNKGAKWINGLCPRKYFKLGI